MSNDLIIEMKKECLNLKEITVSPTLVQVYLMKTNEAETHYDEYLKCITQTRRDKILKMKNKQEQLASLAAGYLVYKCLGVNTDDDLKIGKYGKLYLKSSDKFFNLSHCDDYAVLAIADRELGVDIEPVNISEQLKEIPVKAFSKEEMIWLKNHSSQKDFSKLWTQKEAILKADGRGFYKDPQSISVFCMKDMYVESRYVENHVISCAMGSFFNMEITLL